MNKVYCKNCKYYILTKDAWGKKEYPECKLTKEKKVTFEKVETVFGIPPSIKNKKNNCSDYKNKWWKIWIK